MQPEKITATLATGKNFESILFKIAFAFAEETGRNVWFISPFPIEKVPSNIKPPQREVLQLITFLYLKDYKLLLNQLNGIHLWHKVPSMIILVGFDGYCDFKSQHYNPMKAAMISTALSGSAGACAHKNNTEVQLLVVCDEMEDKSRLQIIRDLYFQKYIHKIDDNIFFNQVTSFFI